MRVRIAQWIAIALVVTGWPGFAGCSVHWVDEEGRLHHGGVVVVREAPRERGSVVDVVSPGAVLVLGTPDAGFTFGLVCQRFVHPQEVWLDDPRSFGEALLAPDPAAVAGVASTEPGAGTAGSAPRRWSVAFASQEGDVARRTTTRLGLGVGLRSGADGERARGPRDLVVGFDQTVLVDPGDDAALAFGPEGSRRVRMDPGWSERREPSKEGTTP